MFKRFRYKRINKATRIKYRETFLKKEDFIWPVFLVEGGSIKEVIPSMPDVYRYSADMLVKDLSELVQLGLSSILVFGIQKKKGIAQSYDPSGIVQSAIPIIKKAFPSLEIISDVCLCSFSDDGHCESGGNDETCDILEKIAISHARAGADIVAPSDMMDGRVLVIKKALIENGFSSVKIMSYAAKYASSFYGPFRDAADCAPRSGDRKTYQMDPANANEALEEIAADVEEGADQIIIKPALSYLDIIAKARSGFSVPVVAYNVSGEFCMIRDAVEKGSCSSEIIEETLVSIKRAGAHRIISYFTPYVLKQLLIKSV